MRKTLIACAAILSTLPNLRAQIVVQSLVGDVRVQRHGASRWETVKVDSRLNAYDTLQTGERSTVTLSFPGQGNTLALDPLTRIVLTESLGSTPSVRRSGVTVFVGKVRTKLAKGNPAADEFASPTTVIGVRGTEFVLAVAEDGTTQIGVLSGEVKVAGATAEALLAANQASTVPLDGDPMDKTAFAGDEDWDTWLRQRSASIKGREQEILDGVARSLERLYSRMDAVEAQKSSRWSRIEELQRLILEARKTGDNARAEALASEMTGLVSESSRLVIEGQNLDIRAKSLLAVAERVVKRSPGRKDLRGRYDDIRQRFETYHRRYAVRPKKGCLGR